MQKIKIIKKSRPLKKAIYNTKNNINSDRKRNLSVSIISNKEKICKFVHKYYLEIFAYSSICLFILFLAFCVPNIILNIILKIQ